MEQNTHIEVEPKFTRGEKCIFIHLIVTFVFIFILILIYVTHLYLVNHSQNGIFSTRRCALIPKQPIGAKNIQVGHLYLNVTNLKFTCNTLLLQPRWSVGPAHCIAVRTHPSLKHLTDAWRLRYRTSLAEQENTDYSIINTRIKRNIIHPNFDKDSFANNIGLLEHTDSISFQEKFDTADASLPPNKNLVIVGWKHTETDFSDSFNDGLFKYDVDLMSDTKCFKAVAPVTMLRSYEFCIMLNQRSTKNIDHGSIVFDNFKPIGIFSWGEKQQKALPMVAINVTSFRDWLSATSNNED